MPSIGEIAVPNRHVVPSGPKTWVVKEPGNTNPLSKHRTQHAAEQAAKQNVKKSGGGQVVIHRPDGTIRDADTISPAIDPYPPKDTQH